jgi:beta-N-acetylhexosaminidase
MTLRQKVGQLLMISFPGTSINSSTAWVIRHWQPGGITLFGDNVSSTAQVKRLDAALQKTSRLPLLISIDQEGGEVNRITSGITVLPSEAVYGRQNNPTQVRSDTAGVGRQLRKLGINMNLAPVLDVAWNPNSSIAKFQRSFGGNAQVDSRLGLAAINGYQSSGIAATGKHVVGLGTTPVDPQFTLPVVKLSQKQWDTELLPFQEAVRARVDAIMVTHVDLPGHTSSGTPASLSYNVVTGVLRDQMKYGGLIMTDSLTMGGVTDHYNTGQIAVMALKAGNDVLLYADGGPLPPGLITKSGNAILDAVRSGKVSMHRLDSAVTRILTLKQRLHLRIAP